MLTVRLYNIHCVDCCLVYHISCDRWMNPLLGEGYKKELELEDLYEARKEDESEILGDRLEK